ncbi:MAG: hypothetical protein AB4050_07860 [Synechococcus sp.]
MADHNSDNGFVSKLSGKPGGKGVKNKTKHILCVNLPTDTVRAKLDTGNPDKDKGWALDFVSLIIGLPSTWGERVLNSDVSRTMSDSRLLLVDLSRQVDRYSRI